MGILDRDTGGLAVRTADGRLVVLDRDVYPLSQTGLASMDGVFAVSRRVVLWELLLRLVLAARVTFVVGGKSLLLALGGR
jgi:hypothetical protein